MESKKLDYDFILAVDQGGHASRACVYAVDGKIKASATCEIDTQQLKKDESVYIQHDANEIIASIQNVISECANQMGTTQKLKFRVGFATQRSTIVCWNYKTAEVLSPAISWQDTRAYKTINNIQHYNQTVKSKTGLFLSAHYGASKIAWCLENYETVQHAYKNNELCIAPLSSYILYSCVEDAPRYVDPATAARTLLFNKDSLDWDDDLLALFSIPKEILPQCVTSRYNFGQLRHWNGVSEVCLCTGDQSAAVLSQGIPRQNEFTVNIGSGAFVLNLNEKYEPPARILSGSIYTDSEHNINAWEGTINGAGIALDWLQKQYPATNVYQQLPIWLRDCSATIPLFINGISGVGSPYWKTTLKSRFIGEVTLPSKSIAVIESIVFLIAENINIMKINSENVIKVTGGLSIINGFCQKLSDITNMKVIRYADKEATLQGTFFLLSDFKLIIDSNKDTFIAENNPALFERFDSWKNIMKYE